MSVLVVPGVVTDVADTNRVSSDYPFVAEVLLPPDSVSKVCTHFAIQLGHDLFGALLCNDAVEPQHRQELAMQIALPLLKTSVPDSSFHGAVHFILSFTSSFRDDFLS